MATIYDLALALTPQIGPKSIVALLDIFGSAARVLSVSAAELSERGLSPRIIGLLSHKVPYELAEHVSQVCRSRNIRIIGRGDQGYPQMLSECPDAPHILYVNGALDMNAGKWVGIVGTRKATVSGVSNTQHIVNSLVAAYPDLVVVSGLAFGIDKAAHTAALDCNIPTVAVMAGWVEDIVPPSHHYIARRILVQGGAIVSDMPPGTVIKGGNFLSRNRLIAGMSNATIVAESGLKGGSLVTADIATSYNRPVFAIPGRSDDENFAGTNMLIKSSRAILYQDPSDLAQELGWERVNVEMATKNRALTGNLTGALLALYNAMPDAQPVTLEEMAEKCATELYTTSSVLMALETRGLVKSLPGRLFEKVRY